MQLQDTVKDAEAGRGQGEGRGTGEAGRGQGEGEGRKGGRGGEQLVTYITTLGL